MKKYFLYFGIVLGILCNYHITQSLDCCSYISVTSEATGDCCINIHVINPQCSGAVITLEIKNGSSWTEVYKDSITQNPVITYCPPNGSGLVEYRVKFTEPFKPGEPYCGGEGPYTEGYTMYSGSINLECCENCPEGYENWFNLVSMKSNDCPNNGCEITHSLNIPDSINCYDSYKVVTDSSSTNVLPLTGDSLSSINRCIASGTTYNAKVILFNTNGDSCVIDKSVSCAEPRDTMDLQQPCTPDCTQDQWIGPKYVSFHLNNACPPYGCFMQGTYYFRKSCNNSYQDIQITRIWRSNKCSSCPDSYFYQLILKQIIAENIMNFEPKEDGCNTTWRISQGGCWSKYSIILIDITTNEQDTIQINEPCSLTDCCLQPMIVCKDSANHTTTITYLPYNSQTINCDSAWLENPYNGGWILNCSPACNWLDGFDTTYVTPPPPPPLNKEGENDLFKNKIGIGVEYSINSSFIELLIRNWNANKIKIYLSTLDGKLLYSNSKQLNKGNNIFNIERTFGTGVFILNIEVDGYIIKSEKLLLTE